MQRKAPYVFTKGQKGEGQQRNADDLQGGLQPANGSTTSGNRFEKRGAPFAAAPILIVFVIFTDRAQYIGCEFCGAVKGPRELVNVLVFLEAAKQFMREHRFCEPEQGWPPAHMAARGENWRVPLGASHSFPARHRMSWEGERQPGEDG